MNILRVALFASLVLVNGSFLAEENGKAPEAPKVEETQKPAGTEENAPVQSEKSESKLSKVADKLYKWSGNTRFVNWLSASSKDKEDKEVVSSTASFVRAHELGVKRVVALFQLGLISAVAYAGYNYFFNAQEDSNVDGDDLSGMFDTEEEDADQN